MKRNEMTPDEQVSDFGGCPVCHGCDGIRVIQRKAWFFCDSHSTKWCCPGVTLFVSVNLFPDARDGDIPF